MDDFLKMDIFFGVATVATIALTALMAVALMYLIRILRILTRLSEGVAEEAKALKADFNEARAAARKGGGEVMGLIKAITKYATRLLGKRKTSKSAS